MKRYLVVVPVVLAIALVGAPAEADEEGPAPPTSTTTAPVTTAPVTTAPVTTVPVTTVPVTTAAPPPVVATATPEVVVTPATDLVHRQQVTVAGTGFTPGVDIGMAECDAGAFSPSDCDLNSAVLVTADATGAWSTPFTVRRKIRNSYETIDCVTAAATCVIGAANLGDYNESAGAPLAFDPSAPLPPPPTVVAAPSTGLVHDQQVIVTARGFAANVSVVVVQCRADAPGTEECDYSSGNYLQAGPTGEVATVTRVHRRIFTPASGVFDCGGTPAACEIEAVDNTDILATGRASISFDPTVPLPPAPVVTVTPTTDLVHLQPLTVTGRGFSPGASITVAQCQGGVASPERCDGSAAAYLNADTTGAWTATLVVRRIIRTYAEDVDCTTAPGACAIVAANVSDYAESAAVDIAFDPTVPPPPPPVVTVTPSTALTHNQIVIVTGSGFAPHSPISIVECVAGSSTPEDCDYTTDPYKETGDAGHFRVKYRVRRVISTYTSGVVDCTEAPQGCELRYEDYSDVLSAGRTPISFDPDAPLPPPPAVAVTPDTDLVNRQTVTVTGTGYPPDEEVQIEVCADGVAATKVGGPIGPPEACDYVAYQNTDGSGGFSAAVKVHRIFRYEGPELDCAKTACVLRVESYSDVLATASVPIAFDDSLPAPPPYPEINVTPGTTLEDGTAVTVTGAGFAPSASVGVGQCVNSPTSERDCDSRVGITVTTDATGAFTATIHVRRVITTANAATIDCSARAGRCLIGAANLADIFGEYDLSPGLEFAPAPPPPPPPQDPPASGPTNAQPRVLGAQFTHAAPAGDPLARTGADVLDHVLVGFVLLALGLLVTVVTRTRTLVLRRP